jgi:hypothetical protein
LNLDAKTLIVAARAVGLVVTVHADRLRVRGPRAAWRLVDLLAERKEEVRSALIGSGALDAPSDPSAPSGSASSSPALVPRDVRLGDRWLPWHFTPEFEARLAKAPVTHLARRLSP